MRHLLLAAALALLPLYAQAQSSNPQNLSTVSVNTSGTIATSNTTPSISGATGALTSGGGIGAAGALWAGTFIGVSGTSLPAFAAGTLGLGGIQSAPTLAANGEGAIYLSTANGLVFQGDGSSNDFTFNNRGGGQACVIGPGAAAMSCGWFVPLASGAPTVGVSLPAAARLGLYGTTSELFSGATDVWDYGVTTASVLTTGVATTINSATFKVTTLAAATAIDTVCYTTATGLFTEEPTGTTCTVSDETKKVGIHPLRWIHSLATILRSSPISYYYVPEMQDPDYHLGFGAQTMEKIAPELVHYEDGKPKAIKQLELLPVTWAAIKELAWSVIGLFVGFLLLAAAVINLYRRDRAMSRRLAALESLR